MSTETETLRKDLKTAVQALRQEATIHTDSTLHTRIRECLGTVPNPRSVPEADRIKLEREVSELVFRTNAQKLLAKLSTKAEEKIATFPSKEMSVRLKNDSFDTWMYEIELVLGTIRELFDQELGNYGAETTVYVVWEDFCEQCLSTLLQNISHVKCFERAESAIEEVISNIKQQPFSPNIMESDRETHLAMNNTAEYAIQQAKVAARATNLPGCLILRIRETVKAVFSQKQMVQGEEGFQALIVGVMMQQKESFRTGYAPYNWDRDLTRFVYTAWDQQKSHCGDYAMRQLEQLQGISQADLMSDEEMRDNSEKNKSHLTLEWKCYLAVAMLVAAIGDVRSVIAGLPTPVVYTAATREAFTQVISLFLWSLNPAYFVNAAEICVASLFLPEFPLLSHIPAAAFLEPYKYGFEEYLNQLQRTTTENFWRRVGGYFTSFFTNNPTATHLPVTFDFQPVSPATTCATTVAISGWISKGEDPADLWAGLKGTAFTGNILNFSWEAGNMWVSAFKSIGVGAGACAVVATGNILIKSLSIVGKLFVPAVVGNPVGAGIASLTSVFTVASWPVDFKISCIHTQFAGRQLARVIYNQGFGQNPTNIIAYSLGCRVAYHCLKELTKLSKGKFIHNVLLMGGAAKNDTEKWRKALGCVSGRVINVYSEGDWILKAFYKPLMCLQPEPIGLGPIRLERVENVDATNYVGGHLSYRDKLPEILIRTGFQP